jgi:hypothetical protein
MEALLIINFPSRVFTIKFSYRTPSRHGKKSPYTGIQWDIEIKTDYPELKAEQILSHSCNEYRETLGGDITGSSWKGTLYLRKHFTPTNLRAWLQVT